MSALTSARLAQIEGHARRFPAMCSLPGPDVLSLVAAAKINSTLLEALKAHDAYLLDAGYSDPDSPDLNPKAAANWRQILAAIDLAESGQ